MEKAQESKKRQTCLVSEQLPWHSSTIAADLLTLWQVAAATGVGFHPLWERKFIFPSPLKTQPCSQCQEILSWPCISHRVGVSLHHSPHCLLSFSASHLHHWTCSSQPSPKPFQCFVQQSNSCCSTTSNPFQSTTFFFLSFTEIWHIWVTRMTKLKSYHHNNFLNIFNDCTYQSM